MLIYNTTIERRLSRYKTNPKQTGLQYVYIKTFYRACFNPKRNQWGMMNTTFLNQETVLKDWFARIDRLINNFENNFRTFYRHTPYTFINETLRNFDTVFSCNFNVYISNRPGKYGILFRCLVTESCYMSKIIPYWSSAINSQSNQSNKKLEMEISSDILNTGRNITGDWLYSSVETAEKLYESGLASSLLFIPPTGCFLFSPKKENCASAYNTTQRSTILVIIFSHFLII